MWSGMECGVKCKWFRLMCGGGCSSCGVFGMVKGLAVVSWGAILCGDGADAFE